MEMIIKDISVSFHKKNVLENVSISLQPGVYGLLGENGAGKTTLFRTILGLQKHGGTVERRGIDHIGYVPQKFDCLHGLNLADTMQYFCCLQKIPEKERGKRTAEVLEMVNLTGEKEKKVRELSGGMLRRLGIAQAMVSRPEMLVMDEPTVGLDPAERIRLREIVQKISGELIIVISSHEIRELDYMCENMIFLHRGRVICVSSIESLQEKYKTEDMEEIYFRILTNNC